VENNLQFVRLIVEGRTLRDVHEAIRDAVRLANLHRCTVELEFNGVIITVCQGDSPKKLIDRYMEDSNRRYERSETK